MKEFALGITLSAILAGNFSSTFSAAAQKMSALTKATENCQSIAKNMASAQRQGIVTVGSYNNAIGKLAQRYEKLAPLAKKYSESQERINGLHKGINGRMVAMGRNTAGMMQAFGMAKGFVAPMQAAISFESAMSDVRKVVDFDTPQQFKEMGKDILELSKRIPMTAEQISQIVAAGGQSGIARDDLLAFAESAAKMGIAFDTTADHAGQMMAQWRTAFNMGQKDVEELADKINHLGNNTAASALQISEVVTRIGPLGEVGGMASGEIAALGASLVGSGISTEIASTGIKNLILTMVAGESATNKQKATLEQLGFSAEGMAQAMQKDAKGAIISLLESVKTLDKETQAATLQNLFGKESIGAIAPLLTNLDGLKKTFAMVGDAAQYTGSSEAEFAAKCDTVENKLELLKNTANGIGIEIGNGMLPAFSNMLNMIAPLSKTFGDFITKNSDVISGVMLAGAGISALAMAGHALAWVWNGMNVVILGAKAAFWGVRGAVLLLKSGILQQMAVSKISAGATWLMTAAQWALNASFLGCPITWIIGGLVALGAVGYVIYQKWDVIKQFFINIWNDPIGALKTFLFEWNPFFAIPNLIYQNWGAIKEWFVLLWNDPAAAIQTFIDGIYQKFGEAFNWLKTGWDNVRQFFSSPITAIVNTVKGGGADVAQNASGGIYGKGAFLTTFAEESGESAIPHTPTARNIGLLAETNRIMGNPLGGGNVSINFNPTINVSGDGNVAQEIAKISMRELKRMLQEIQTDGRRVAYA